jgi:hypothetical protein
VYLHNTYFSISDRIWGTNFNLVKVFSTPKGIRIPVCSVKGSCPRPLDDGGKQFSGQRDSNARHQPWQGCTLPLSYARFMLKDGPESTRNL